ncbi:hypothetical protein AV540_21685 [Brevibacillus parabrevis]|nr:hypothetical protein AV540_21685 [Brevibacillus parabrevis]
MGGQKHLTNCSNNSSRTVLSLKLIKVLFPTVKEFPFDIVLAELLAELAIPFAVLVRALW